MGCTMNDLHPDQQQLFDQLREPHQLARASDPDTSHQAAALRRGTQRWRMLSAFKQMQGVPTTWDRAADIAGIAAQSSPWSRCTDLCHAGFLEAVGQAPSKTGSAATTYVITAEGLGAL